MPWRARYDFWIFACVCSLMLVMCAVPSHAGDTAALLGEYEAQGTPVDGHAPLRVSLVSDAAVVTPSDALRVGLSIHLDPGWHIYWQQPGAAGLSTQVTWRSGDALLGDIMWPAPEVFRESDGVVTYGYAGETLLWSQATVSDSVAGHLDVEAHIDYLACNIICSPGQVTVRRRIAVGRASVPADKAIQNLFARYQGQLPVAPEAVGLGITASTTPEALQAGDEFMLHVRLAWHDASHKAALQFRREAFVPNAAMDLAAHLVGARAGKDAATPALLTFKGRVGPGSHNLRLGGIVLLEGAQGPLQPVRIEVPITVQGVKPGEALRQGAIPTSANPAPEVMPRLMMPASQASEMSLGYALLLALVGGLILNLMPCVLPVLALKVVGMAHIRHATSGTRHAVVHGLAYTLGVVASLAALASVVCGLRAAGTAVGWGFQFQEPWFVAAVAAVLVLFALNCFGVFELYVGDAGLGQAVHSAQGIRRSIFDGVLAVVLATPCSAPFLGTAIAFALEQPALVIYLIFMTIGVGLALPYVLLTAMPQGLRFVPRPGTWMLHLKVVLGFGLLVTAVWLVWIMGRFVGVDGMASVLLTLVLTALCGWIFGRVAARWPEMSLSNFVVLLVVVGGLHLLILRGVLQGRNPETGNVAQGSLPEGWQAYSEDAVREALAAHKPVFVDFTADWCLTCKYNERHVLGDAGVAQALLHKHVVMLRADWTRRDEAIRVTLSRFGRAGVPMYLLYHPDSPDMPQLLPELLSVSQLRDAIGSLP